jgi:hypothetical protein
MHDERFRFKLISGGAGNPESDEMAGPITRLGLWDRFPVVHRQRLWMVAATKLALLGTLIWFYLRLR